jgi:outer membrane autotransporter protein
VIFPTVDVALSYLSKSLIMTIQSTIFDTTGLHGNPLIVAEYIKAHMTGSGDFGTIIKDLSKLSESALNQALDQFHPAPFQALTFTAGDTAHMINSSFVNRLYVLRQSTEGADPCNSGIGGWFTASGDFIRQSKVDGLRRFETSNEGISLGLDKMFSNSLVLGLGAGYSHTNLHWGEGCGHVNIEGYYLGPYLSFFKDNYYIDASILGFINRDKADRRIHFQSIDRRAKSRHDVYGVNPHLGGGFEFSYCSVEVIPFFNMDYYFVEQNKIHERGADSLNLHVRKNRSNLLLAEGGLQIAKPMDFRGGRLIPNGFISWSGYRLFSNDKYTASFEGINQTFTVFGTKHCFNQLNIGAGVTYEVNNRLSLDSGYNILIGDRRQEQRVNLQLDYRF